MERQFTVRDKEYKTTTQFIGNARLYWKGWETDTRTLKTEGWVITLVYNHVTGTEKLYCREPLSKLMGRCMFNDEPGFLHVLDFLSHEKNIRSGKPLIYLDKVKKSSEIVELLKAV